MVGKNGVGKTSVLEAINLATTFSFVENKIKPDDFNDDNKEIKIILEFNEFFFINIPDGWQTKKLPSRKIKFIANYRKKATPGKTFSSIFTVEQYAIPYEFSDREKLSIKNNKDIPRSVIKQDGKFKFKRENNTETKINNRMLFIGNNLDCFPSIFYFSKERDRDLKPGYFTAFQKILDEFNWRFFKEYKKMKKDDYIEKWDNTYSFIMNKMKGPGQIEVINSLKDELKNFMEEKFKGFEVSLFNLQQPFNGAFFSLRKNDKLITLSRIASGELMIVTYLLLKLISKLSKREIIFLIDDPELHLHPQFQYELFNKIKSSEFQHIFATHSDVFIDLGNWKTIKRLADNKIYPNKNLLQKKYGSSVNNEKKLRDHLDDIKNFCQDKTIFNREDNEILFCEKCLLVEGPNDKYGFLALANKLDLDFSKLTIRYCIGKDKIHFYQTICLAYGINFFVVYDQDTNGKDNLIEELSLKKKSFSFKTSFEDIIGNKKLYEILEKIDKLDKKSLDKNIKNCLKNINRFLKN